MGLVVVVVVVVVVVEEVVVVVVVVVVAPSLGFQVWAPNWARTLFFLMCLGLEVWALIACMVHRGCK